MGDIVVLKESYGSSTAKKEYIEAVDGRLITCDRSERFTSVFDLFRSVFLPQGYPDSVSEDYMQYQLWDTLQAFASSITGTLATQAVLKGVGVGDESATPLAATITWLLKDGMGMLGRIGFAWFQGTSLDCDAKRWRLFADILNDCAIFLEILAPLFQGYFTLIVCIAGVSKSIVGVAGGATRAALTQHQARRNNMADVSAKDGSQETLVNLAALICGLLMMPVVSGHQTLTWVLFFLFTMLHLFSNFMAVKAVKMETLNQARLHILVQHYLQAQTTFHGAISSDILPVKIVNMQEPVLWRTRRKLEIFLGTSFAAMMKSPSEFSKLKKIYAGDRYILDLDLSTGKIYILLHETQTVDSQIKACFHAELVNFIVEKIGKKENINEDFQNVVAIAENGNCAEVVEESCRLVSRLYPVFMAELPREGWLTSYALLGADEWRAKWLDTELLGKKLY
ncbi:RUS1 family protein C16orf58 homolog [Lingula anatina]|uniref:RUS1 family protein C16orf58 homolog n=1 Tax=Lingula anatina TaxID=7574 RepID=A0A1S3J6L0_LINAN|nr:RUS1 family protein C16orf58 homolog [Lingula anatina]|eukprot:XP_013405479.1 RUS1 family protein C16orf58 homolog [Lingula anatina]